MSAILEDAQLLAKKALVTVIIYIVPVTIMVGGLWLIKHSLGGDEVSVGQPKTEINLESVQP